MSYGITGGIDDVINVERDPLQRRPEVRIRDLRQHRENTITDDEMFPGGGRHDSPVERRYVIIVSTLAWLSAGVCAFAHIATPAAYMTDLFDHGR